MLKDLFNRHLNIILTLSLAAIAFAVVFHVLFYIVLPGYTPAIRADHIIMPSLTSNNAASVTAAKSLQQSGSMNWIIVVSALLTVGLVGVIGLSFYGHIRSQKSQRDQVRRQNLQRLKKAFFDYRAIHGHFPLSATYRHEYYTAINLSKDWNYYGLPNAEQMRQVLPEWPISDPSLDYHSSQQFNQYLYYPREEGQFFDLYAHLEMPESPAVDYNQVDNLLRSWGDYNYKVSSQTDDDQIVAPPPPALNPQALSEEERAAQQAIVEQTIAVDAHEVNAELQFLADEVVANPRPALPDPIESSSQAAPATAADQFGQLYQAVEAKQAIHHSSMPSAPAQAPASIDPPVADILAEPTPAQPLADKSPSEPGS